MMAYYWPSERKMMIRLKVLQNKEEWLSHRNKGIGGSEIASILGKNPYLTNTDLWRIKTGRIAREDISDKACVKYGHSAEEHIRALFELDHPEFRVSYIDNNSWSNDDYPWALASLDGWIEDENGRFGVLEIKTTELQRSTDWDRWTDRIPDNYYCQVLMYMAVTDADFVVLRAAIKHTANNEKRTSIRDYYLYREEVEESIKYLMEQGRIFWEMVANDQEPALILPEI